MRARPYLCVLYNKIVDFVYNWASLNLYKKCKERLCLSCTIPCLCAFAFLCISGLKSGALRSSLIREFWNKKISWRFFVQETKKFKKNFLFKKRKAFLWMQNISLNKKLRTKAQRNKEILKEFTKKSLRIFCAQDPVFVSCSRNAQAFLWMHSISGAQEL